LLFQWVSVLSDLGLPEGEIVSQHRGSKESLQEIFNRTRRYRFSGYVRLQQTIEEKRSEGIVGFELGQPLLSVYVFKWDKDGRAGRVYMGRKAIEFLWEDSVYPDCNITLHANVPQDEIMALFPRSEIGMIDLVPPSFLPSPPSKISEAVEDPLVTPFLKIWSEKGYDLSSLDRLLRRNREEARLALPYFETNLTRLEGLKDRVFLLDTLGYEREVESLKRKMVDPERIEEIEAEISRFKRRIDEKDSVNNAEKEIHLGRDRKLVDEKMDAVYDLILQYHKMRSVGDKTISCPECGSYLNPEGDCPICLAGLQDEPVIGRRLNPRLKFESFVVGSNTRFTEAAARTVAMNPGESYNPLFIYSRSGLGKTHLLQAIGNRIMEIDASARVVYTSTEVLESELIEAIGNRKLESFREEYRKVDVLLIDDLQFIAGREETQEELFHLFNDLVERRRQIVLACDRLPKDIPSLGERLITRFESGLIADLQAPDLETRIAILEKMVEEKGLEVPREVLIFIAEVCRSNVREMEGGLNRILAYSSLMKSAIGLETAREVLTYEKPVELEMEPQSLADGVSYLIEERKAIASHALAASKLSEGYKTMAITRSHPRYLRERCIGGEPRILWLTDHESEQEDTVPPSLERIMLLIDEFMEEDGRKIILLDDVQYLMSNTSFEGVVRFIRSVVDKVHENITIFIVSVNPESLDPQNRSILEREMEVIREADARA
jgi:chromosomal replication initiator protein DnaA